MKLRLIDTGSMPGALNMGVDEALLNAVAAGNSEPVLRLYRWEPSCVTIGYFQSMLEEVDLDACFRAGVDAVRRVTGGGAVFHQNEITYSVILREGTPLAPADILESYRLICDGVIAGIGLLGVTAQFVPINDIVAGGKKVSGNAQTRKRSCLLQHGTVLLDVDPEAMFSLLKVPAEKLKGKLIEDVKARVTGLSALLGREVPYLEAAGALAEGFAMAWAGVGVSLQPGGLSGGELEEAERIAANTYSSEAWNLRR